MKSFIFCLFFLVFFLNSVFAQNSKKVVISKQQYKIDSLNQVDKLKTQQIDKLSNEIKRLQIELSKVKDPKSPPLNSKNAQELENKVAQQQLELKKQKAEIEALQLKIKKLQDQLVLKGTPNGKVVAKGTDNSSHQVVTTIKIGAQTWMTHNLDVTQFRNGDQIREAKSDAEWEECAKKKIPAWCYYHNDEALGVKYGKLYNWYAVNDPRGLAPTGYRIPSEEDWNKLITELGGEEVAAPKMRFGKQWGDSILVTSSKGNFGAMPSGWRKFSDEKIEFLNEGAYWWSSTALSLKFAWTRYILFHSKEVKSYCYNKGSGLSIRCVKD